MSAVGIAPFTMATPGASTLRTLSACLQPPTSVSVTVLDVVARATSTPAVGPGWTMGSAILPEPGLSTSRSLEGIALRLFDRYNGFTFNYGHW